jgi:hypothetical protein
MSCLPNVWRLWWAILDFAGREVKTACVIGKPLALILLIAAATAATGAAAAQPTHKCDQLDPVADAGWAVVPSLETAGVKDSAPYQAGASGDWFIDRTTTLLPFCNYYDELGIYSMRSYRLSPQEKTERIAICRGNKAVPPYAGRCPPSKP